MVNVVLVHGLWTDGSSWERVIPLLHRAGHRVTAAQLPLTGLADDIDALAAVLDELDGPVVLAGWSYGGAVVTGAATGRPEVVGLVYLAGLAPDEGERCSDVLRRFPAPKGNLGVYSDRRGRMWIEQEHYRELIGADLEPEVAAVRACVQRPASRDCIGGVAPEPAWRTIPSWYQISEHDNAISPEAQRFLAERMGATIISLPTSHAVPLTRADAVADLIASAAVNSPVV